MSANCLSNPRDLIRSQINPVKSLDLQDPSINMKSRVPSQLIAANKVYDKDDSILILFTILFPFNERPLRFLNLQLIFASSI